ncbi:MAG: peptidoglycan DD-metalloendopeptidase family protein, partial [Desulfotomaculales bacterium]
QGHFQYHYEWRTECGEGGCVTYEALVKTVQILPDRFQRLKDWMVEEYGIGKDSDELEIAKEFVWQAMYAFDNPKKEWLEWLIQKYGSYVQVEMASAAMIPPEYGPYLEEAEERFGIPRWFLAALIEKESSWDPMAVNSETGCFGLTQQHPDHWRERWKRLGFTPPEDYQWDPRAQILAGAMVLADYTGDTDAIDWEGDGWKTDGRLKKALARYGGYGDNVELAERDGYISFILGVAENVKERKAVWPAPGYYVITCKFGEKDDLHPAGHRGIDIALADGAKVVSASGGRVTFVGWDNPGNPKEGYGYYMTIRDGNHLYKYAHLIPGSETVHKGDPVQPGQAIAKGDNTGHSTGPHLHFEVRDMMQVGPDGNPVAIDPLMVVRPW